MKAKANVYYLLACLFLINACSPTFETTQNTSNLTYVDPMIGTDAHGHTFPGATVPFGMLQLSPSNDFKNWDWCSGYHYSDSVLKGFAHNHISGPGLSGLGDILFMPTSKLHLSPGTEKNPENGYRSRFSHENESASPGYYQVYLEDSKVNVELTTSTRVGYHRYTFDGQGEKFVTIDPTHGIADFAYETSINIISDTEISGYKKSKSGTAGDRTVYFYAVFSKPFKNTGIGIANEVQNGEKNLSGIDVKGFASFDIIKGESIEVEVSLSYVSKEGAKANWESEGSKLNFDLAKTAAENLWQEKLEKITVATSNESKKRTFYTALYHSFISPNLISDVDGKYFLEGNIRESAIPQFSNFSTWDTYRALHPLFTIIEQEKTAEIVNSMVSRHTEAGLVLPGWEAIGYDNICMIGYNMTSPIADAVLKNISGINAEEAYAAIKAAAFDKTKHSQNYDQNGMDGYLKYGYVTGEIGSSVSKTTEQNYYDWAIGKVAAKLKKTKDATLFDQRSKAWRNLFHNGTGYLFPKLSTGELVELETNTWNGLRSNYVSGNVWAYSAYTPHDMKAAIQLQGGREAYTNWLDGIFNNNIELEGHQHVDISGFIGKYGHGDEPGHQMPYLFNIAGKPWLTQKYVSEVVNTMYSDKPDGLINNEDLGQMSAWYIFSTLGFYPLAPGDLTYQFGAPYFNEATIELENGKQFKVIAKNQSDENIYVQKAWLNGKEYDKNHIRHTDILAGGILEFEMGDDPNKAWGTEPENSSLGAFNDLKKPEVKQLAALAPIDKNNNNFFEDEYSIVLTSADEQAQIYYTLDGTIPDITSKKYEAPIKIISDTELKAIATLADLASSTVYTRKYFKSVLANMPEEYPKILVAEKETPYGNADCSMIFDQIIASESYSDGRWTGLKEDFDITLDLGSNRLISSFSIGGLTDTGVWIFPPDKIEVYAGSTIDDLRLIGGTDIPELKEDAKKVVRYKFDIQPDNYRFLMFKVKNYGIAPVWHGAGKGEKMWLFLDEIIIK